MANRRRFLAILLSLLMLLQALPMSALAEGWNVARSNIEEGATYYTVTFEVEDTAVATQLIESGETVSTFPEDPFKADYQFDGWFVEDAKFTSSTAVSADTTVKAKFTPIDAYEVTIKYVDKAGDEVADSIVRSYLVTDAQDVIESPASVVVGKGEEQKTLYPDRASVTINPAKLPAEDENADKKVVYTVTYAESNATYTVKHFLKNLEGEGYTEIEKTAQTLNGVVGSSSVPDPLSTDTYPYIEYEKYDPATVAVDGSTVIKVYYTRKNVTLTYDSQGGSYIAPKFAPYGSTVNVYSFVPGELTCGRDEHIHSEKPSGNGDYNGQVSGCYTWNGNWLWGSWNLTCGKSKHTHDASCYTEDAYDPMPTRTGYTFAGWYTDPQCTTRADEQTVLNGDQTVYAKWEAGQADYTIVYLEQVYDNAIGDTRYVYYTSQVGTGTVGEMARPRQLNSGIKYKVYRGGDGAVIKADSSTVVYAYYDLIEYTFVFDLGRNATLTIGGKDYKGDEYSFKAVYGQDVSKMWPTTDMVSGKDLYGWVPNHDRSTTYVTLRFEVTDDMLPSSGTTASYTASYSSGTQRIVRYWLQTTDGSGYEVSDRYSQVLISTSNLKAKELSGFTLRNSKPTGNQYPQQYEQEVNIEFEGKYYWDIDVHNFYYTRSQYDITYYYGTKELDDRQNVYFGADINNDTYNWTPTPELVNLPDDYTFVGWYDNAECLGDPYAFTTMPANALALYAKFTPPQRTVTLVYYEGYEGTEPKAIRVIYNEKVESLPTPTRPGYTFLGWFTNSAATEPFDINRPITENMTIYAGWQRKALEYKVRYLEEGTNKPLLLEQTIRNAEYTEGEEVRASAPTISGYRVDEMTKSIKLNIDPNQNVITFYYAQRQNQEYSVYYYEQGTETSVAAPKTEVVTAEVERVVEMAVAPTMPGYEDYYPIEKVKTATVTTSLREIIFYYAPYGTVTYTINHVDKGGKAIADPDSVTIKIGDSIQPEDEAKTITGYTFDSVEDGKAYLVAEKTGTVTVNLYYNKTGLTVSAADVEQVYDGKAYGVVATANMDGATIKYKDANENFTLERPTYTNVGEYTVEFQAELYGYETATGSATVTITKRPVTITAANAEKTYGEADPAFVDAIMSGHVEGELGEIDLSVVRSDAGDDTLGTHEDVLSIEATKDELEAAYTNYTFTINPADFVIRRERERSDGKRGERREGVRRGGVRSRSDRERGRRDDQVQGCRWELHAGREPDVHGRGQVPGRIPGGTVRI